MVLFCTQVIFSFPFIQLNCVGRLYALHHVWINGNSLMEMWISSFERGQLHGILFNSNFPGNVNIMPIFNNVACSKMKTLN